MGIVITALVVILVIIVSSIVILKLMPDSVGAYYIRDVIERITEKFGNG